MKVDLLEKPRLQLAVDTDTIQDALSIIDKTYPNFDILEIGTPLIIAEGVIAVREIRKKCPEKLILADCKIMDAGYWEAALAYKAGADIVTVLGCADDATVRGVVKAANEYNGLVMADLINCRDIVGRAKTIEQMGVDILCLHAAVDAGNSAQCLFTELISVRRNVGIPLAVAGGITQNTIEDAILSGANITVVGSAIIKSDDPGKVSCSMMRTLDSIGPYMIAENESIPPKQIIMSVCSEIMNCADHISNESIISVADSIENADSIFVAAAGRSGFAVKGFAMRLMHMGYNVYVVGEVTTPSMSSNDLLLIGSGSGNTASLVAMATKAKSIGAKVSLITINPESSIGKIADYVIKIPAPSPKADVESGLINTVQPMGSLFEQSMYIMLDSLVVYMMHKHGLNSDEMFKRHANLE